MMRVQAEDAKGPTYGRYLGGKLLGDQEFCMQIDAHMDFEDGWDRQLLEMWGLANNEYGILTTYVPHLDQLHLNLNGRYEVSEEGREGGRHLKWNGGSTEQGGRRTSASAFVHSFIHLAGSHD